MENMTNEYDLQAVPSGYRIVRKGGINYIPVFETFPPLDEDVLNKIIETLENSYEQGYSNGWQECCNQMGIVIDY